MDAGIWTHDHWLGSPAVYPLCYLCDNDNWLVRESYFYQKKICINERPHQWKHWICILCWPWVITTLSFTSTSLIFFASRRYIPSVCSISLLNGPLHEGTRKASLREEWWRIVQLATTLRPTRLLWQESKDKEEEYFVTFLVYLWASFHIMALKYRFTLRTILKCSPLPIVTYNLNL